MIGMYFVELDICKSDNRYALVFQVSGPEVYAFGIVLTGLCVETWYPIHDRVAEFLSDFLQETAELLGVHIRGPSLN